MLNIQLAGYCIAIHGSLPGSIESKLCVDKNKKHCTRSKVSKLLTSHCCRVSLATFLPTLLTSLPSSLLRKICNTLLQ